MSMEDDVIKEAFINLANATKDASEKKFMWLRNLLIIASAIFGAFISIADKPEYYCLNYYLHVISIVSLSLGILLGTIYLYSQVVVAVLVSEGLREQLYKLQKNPETYVQTGLANPPKHYRWIEKGCYFFLLVALIGLVALSSLI